MRELQLDVDQSTADTLVLSLTFGDDPGHSETFTLPVTDSLRELILSAGDTTTPPQSAPAEVEEEKTDTACAVTSLAERKKVQAPDSRLSKPLPISIKDLQNRIRAGASIAALASECDVPESRIEPFAHPILQERARFAELGRGAHPVRQDGPARFSLSEVLATAFAARGIPLDDVEWDAFKDPATDWVIAVRYPDQDSKTGGRLQAEWTWKKDSISTATALPRNDEALDLSDPDNRQWLIDGDGPDDEDHINSDLFSATTDLNDFDTDPGDASSNVTQLRRKTAKKKTPDETNTSAADILLPPAEEDAEQKPKPKRRRAETPHWEDVLLGVRAATKRPKK